MCSVAVLNKITVMWWAWGFVAMQREEILLFLHKMCKCLYGCVLIMSNKLTSHLRSW